MKKSLFGLILLPLLVISCTKPEGLFTEGDNIFGRYNNFKITGEAKLSDGAIASIFFCRTINNDGYEVLFRNGDIDGTIKTGSLTHVRNLYRSLAKDNEWFDFSISAYDKYISVFINGKQVVSYLEPDKPWRSDEHLTQLFAKGRLGLSVKTGSVELRNVVVIDKPESTKEEIPSPQDEQYDKIIRLQQIDFPVIDYHVHLKGGLTKEMAHKMSMEYGINYGVAPNAGEGGVGRMLSNDKEVRKYYHEIKDEPFLLGVQGEGRKWTQTFSSDALGLFEYLFTDAMTIIDHKGRNSRIYRKEEVKYDKITKDEYMDHLVEQIVLILSNEPADIYANATYIPEDMQLYYDKYWTDERIDKVLTVMQENHIALEINPRYKIPSCKIIMKAKERGIKFTFGTNNVDADLSRLKYCIEVIDICGLTPEDMWFPSMSVRRTRPTIIYNNFSIDGKTVIKPKQGKKK